MSSLTTLTTVTTTAIVANVKRATSSDDMPTLTSGLSETSLDITTIPSRASNPYIHESTLPTGLVFIVVGCILGMMLIGIVLYRITTYFIFSSKARREKEMYFANGLFPHHYHDNGSSVGGFGGSGVFSNTPSRAGGTPSHYSMLNTSTASLSTDSSTSRSGQGRAYRNNITSDKYAQRQSMFVNPSLNIKQLDMLLDHPSDTASTLALGSHAGMYKQQNNSSVGSLILLKNQTASGAARDGSVSEFSNRPKMTINMLGESSTIDTASSQGSMLGLKMMNLEKLNTSSQSAVRAPSLYLEDLLNEKEKGEDNLL